MGGILLGGRRARRRKAEKGGTEGKRKEEGELTGRKNLVCKEEVVDEAN